MKGAWFPPLVKCGPDGKPCREAKAHEKSGDELSGWNLLQVRPALRYARALAATARILSSPNRATVNASCFQ